MIACEPLLETRLHEVLRDGRLVLSADANESLTTVISEHWQNSVRLNQPLAILADRAVAATAAAIVEQRCSTVGNHQLSGTSGRSRAPIR